MFAIDTLGCGLSSRPPWKLGDGVDCDVDAAESFFIEGMEQWRVASGIEKMVRPACDVQCSAFLAIPSGVEADKQGGASEGAGCRCWQDIQWEVT